MKVGHQAKVAFSPGCRGELAEVASLSAISWHKLEAIVTVPSYQHVPRDLRVR
jgi:hypothetical protein